MAIRYKLFDVADRLGLEYTATGYISCPFCGTPKARKNLHLNAKDDNWNCNKCGTSGGVLRLFSEIYLGQPLPDSNEGRSDVRKKLIEFMGDSETHYNYQPPERKRVPDVPVANDNKLHSVYSAMAELPDLQLLAAHKKDLINRGLTEDVIIRNGYRSIPSWPVIPDIYSDMYEEAGGEDLRINLCDNPPKRRDVLFGLMIAHKLVSAGHDLHGVPGFFRFGDRYCFWCSPGLLIPTRNKNKQIVIWQLRQKDKKRKYLTLSNANLPGAVNSSVSRCHHPLGNATLKNGVPVIYTEGALKADIALHLTGNSSVYLAIAGVNNRPDLLRVLEDMRNQGVREVYNGLDMDRITKITVRNASAKIKADIQKLNITVRELYWDPQYARSKLMSLNMIAKLRNVPIPQTIYPTVYEQLAGVSAALDEAGIDVYNITNSSGKSESFYWDPDTKGIDDFYLHYRDES